MKTSNVMLSVIAGAAAGVLVGVLYAPDKGSNTRGKISRKTNEYAQGIKDQLNYIAERVTSPFNGRRDNGLVETPRMKLSEATHKPIV
jgi:gas vesicle protein